MRRTSPRSGLASGLLLLALALALASACSADDDAAVASDGDATDTEASTETDNDAGSGSGSGDAGSSADDGSYEALVDSGYLGSYSLANDAFGTMVTVSVEGDTRTIETNALPDHETGEFPNQGNPNSISEQDLTWEYPVEPVYTGTATEVRVTGVAVNGIKFEPGTAETVSCATGETDRVEAIQDVVDFGLDVNNAHVQPTGEYHYHGVSEFLVDAYATDEDLVHIGFAADGHLIYYSKSGAYASSYVLATEARTGTDCEISLPTGDAFDLEGTTPDGAYTSDWIYTEGSGDLDQCNGTTVDGQYVYLVTDAYLYISRCLNGEVSEAAGVGAGGAAPGNGGGAAPLRPPPGG